MITSTALFVDNLFIMPFEISLLNVQLCSTYNSHDL